MTVAAFNDSMNKSRLERTQPSILLSLQVLGGQLLVMALTGERVDEGLLDGVLKIHTAPAITSENLTNLPDAKPDPGFVPIEVPGQADWEPTTDPQVLVARKHLIVAQDRARAAITAYGDAERDDYPRGEARIRITKERDAAMKALEEAKQALAAAE